jgi:excinuclease ABC subunit B
VRTVVPVSTTSATPRDYATNLPAPAPGVFRVETPFSPSGDQPAAIKALVGGLRDGLRYQTLEGITGSGKTATIAWIIEQAQRPTLILEPNKSLAAQLASELREMMPSNHVEFFVSYYDYYQPEAYIPRTDTFIEKDSAVNEEIDRLRHAATSSLLLHRDTVVVASVSCIYGLGNPQEYAAHMLHVAVGDDVPRRELLTRLTQMQYARNDLVLERGNFRVRGDTLEICPAYSSEALRFSFFGDEVESVTFFNPVTGATLGQVPEVTLFAATHYASSPEVLARATASIEEELRESLAAFTKEGKLLEAQRLRTRTEHDLEMIEVAGFCSGIENYSAHLDGRYPGERPFTLLDFFPRDFLMVIDESHVAVPQIGGMYAGDRSRKATLVKHGFRLPSALDNRPLTFNEFEALVGQTIFVSATPGPFEEGHSDAVVEQVLRPTGLLDPTITVVPTKNQIDDMRVRIDEVVARGERVLVTALTKRMSEDLTDYFTKEGYRARYLHSDIATVERIEILRSLRLGEYDILVGINLLREGLDLPEVSLVVILDADKEGFLRSRRALIQTIGRAARNANGQAILYADRITDSMRAAITTTRRRRGVQEAYNKEHGINPTSITKDVADILGRLRAPAPTTKARRPSDHLTGSDTDAQAALVEEAMLVAASELRFEEAALLRDQLQLLELEGREHNEKGSAR